MHNKVMNWLDNRDLGLLLIRIAIGVVFIYTGWYKFSNLEMVIDGFASMGLNSFMLYLVATTELVGGIAMLLGAYVRYAGLALSVVMVFAICLVTRKMGFEASQLPMILLAASLGIAMIGSGKYSVRM